MAPILIIIIIIIKSEHAVDAENGARTFWLESMTRGGYRNRIKYSVRISLNEGPATHTLTHTSYVVT